MSISPLLQNTMIFTIASTLLLALAVRMRGAKTVLSIPRSGWLWVTAFSLASWLSVLAFWSGVQKMDPSLAAFLTRAEVPVAILLGMIFLREKFSRAEILGALLSIGGIVVMRLTLRVEYSTGFWLVLAGALLFGFAEFCSKLALRTVNPLALTAIRNTLMCLLYWVVFVAVEGQFSGLDEVWVGVIALGILGPLLTRLLYVIALERMPLSKLAIITQSQPVFVVLIALIAFGQLPTLREYVGGILILSGVLIMVVSRLKWINHITRSLHINR